MHRPQARVLRAALDRVQSLWLTVHVEEKPQAKNAPQDQECQAAIVDNSFLTALLRFNLGRYYRCQRGSIADILTTLIAVVVALRHLGMAERTRLHHGHSFPGGWHGLGILAGQQDT